MKIELAVVTDFVEYVGTRRVIHIFYKVQKGNFKI